MAPDGTLLAASANGETCESIRVWSLPAGKVMATLEGFNSYIFGPISSQGTLLAVGGQDREGQVLVWDLRSGCSAGYLSDPSPRR